MKDHEEGVSAMASTAPEPVVTEEMEEIAPRLTHEQLGELLALLQGSDSVELKVTVPQADRRATVERLGMDVLDAEIRQVAFFDTPDLRLFEHGVVVRARRIQRRDGDSVVKLRPVDPAHLTDKLRKAAGFGVEVDALPGGFVCSARMKAKVEDGLLRRVFAGEKAVHKLFTKHQRSLFEDHAPDGIALDDLAVLGPINILKLKFTPEGYPRPLVVELWSYPDGGQILELSTKCAPADAFAVTAETKEFLAARGVDLGAPQQTKTRTALAYFAGGGDDG
ncbi:adenylate cyclase [Nocardioides sp. GY 10113]|uniref:adenylate cyclase n=1 Tax=Nocardioides sp. GY 10113 TaxID=2569761 RepID=UPI0010A8A967|nr:adenylate cyclase [Nocardioides sp. GY 10113]TIC88094.1 adenylate cyclase [Nocardioides sp. GY 10113]